MVSKKFFGLPLVSIIVAIILIFGSSTFVAARFLYNSNYGASVTVLSDNLSLYLDGACQTPFDSNVTIDFGELYPCEESETVTFYMKNESGGNSKVFPQMSIRNLPYGITINENLYGQISSDPNWTNLYIPNSVNWIPNGMTAQVANVELSATNTTDFTVTINSMPTTGTIKIGDEVISYTSISIADLAHGGDNKYHLRGLTRGKYGTPITAHPVSSGVSWGTAQIIELNALDTGEIQPVELSVVVGDAESGQLSFEILMQATSEH